MEHDSCGQPINKTRSELEADYETYINRGTKAVVPNHGAAPEYSRSDIRKILEAFEKEYDEKAVKQLDTFMEGFTRKIDERIEKLLKLEETIDTFKDSMGNMEDFLDSLEDRISLIEDEI
jgi:hypothetical protein